MYFKIHESYRDVVAICDSGLLGKRFEEGDFNLEVKENFFKGEEISKDKLLVLIENMLKEDATFNIVGKESVGVALESGIISEEQIGKIQGVPFALILA